MSQSLRLLTGAQAFGYGPSSKLVTVARQLQAAGFSIDFCGEGIALSFAQMNHAVFHELCFEPSVVDLPASAGYQATITVMSPAIAAWGYAHAVPVFAIDSLYWLWQWPDEYLAQVPTEIRRFKGSGDAAGLLAYIDSLPRHVGQFANHLMADVSFVQSYPGMYRQDAADDLLNLVEVGPIIDTHFQTAAPRDSLVISFAGMINPLVTDENMRRYFQLVADLLAPTLAELDPSLVVIYAVNSELTDVAQSILKHTVTSLPHDDMLRAVNRAIAVVTPPGITTFYECLCYGTPALSLPEQHYGHFPNYQRLADLTGSPEDFRRLYPEALLAYRLGREATTPTTQVAEIYRHIDALLTGGQPAALVDMQATLHQAITGLLDPAHHRATADAQRAALSPLLTSFTGADEVTGAIRQHLT